MNKYSYSIKIFCRIVFFLCCFFAFPDSLNTSLENVASSNLKKSFFSVHTSIAPNVRIGSGFEYVFQEYNDVLSRLDWQFLPAAGISANAELYVFDTFHIGLNTSFFLPHRTGKMRDSDFMNNTDKTMLTRFSEHICMLEQGLECWAFAGWMLPLAEYTSKGNAITIYTEPCIGVRYYVHRWLASDGYLQYAENGNAVTSDVPKIAYKGKAATYSQKFILPNVGILFKFNLPKKWYIKNLLQVCPQVLGDCKDIHHGRDITFNDIFNDRGFSFHLNFYVEKNVTKPVSIFLSVDYTSVISYNGLTLMKKTSTGEILKVLPEGAAGTSLYVLNFGIGVVLKFGSVK